MTTALQVLASSLQVSQDEAKSVVKNMILATKPTQHGVAQVATDAEMAVVLSTCARYSLNPILKEVHAFVGKSGKLSVVIGVDGWIKIMNRQPDFDGVEFDDNLDSSGKIISITCKIYTKNRSRPTCITEYLDECAQASSTPWQKFPKRMLRNKALGQCVRVAFGISEVIDDDEKERIQRSEKDITPMQRNFDAYAQAKSIEQVNDQDIMHEADALFADCESESDLTSCAIQIKAQLGAGFHVYKERLIELKKAHSERIANENAEILDAEAAEQDNEEDVPF